MKENRYVRYVFKELPATNRSYYLQFVNRRKLTEVYHSHDFYELIIFLEGYACHYVNGKRYEIHSGQMVCLCPGDQHCFVSQSPDISVVSLSVETSEFINVAAVFGYSLDKNDACLPIDCQDMKDLIHSYTASCLSSDRMTDYKLLLCHLLGKMMNQPDLHHHAQIADVLEQMHQPENMREGINAMIRLSGYSRSQVYRLVKQYTGRTVNEYLISLRLDTAYKYILYTDDAIEQISERVGYSSFSYFNQLFKRNCNITPAQLRKTRNVNTI